jgi:GNAT superfamily N-acetyltransferase
MPLRITKFVDEYAQLAAWTGESEAQLRAEEDYHAGDRERWLAWDGQEVVGALHPWRSPDGRLRLHYDRCRADAYAPLSTVVDGECFTTLDMKDQDGLAELAGAGFAPSRREHWYEVPVARIEAAVPAGLDIVTGDRTELESLMLLDCALRGDIPGAADWAPDPVWFREETYDSPFFDPRTYCVAIDGTAYVGLARIWNGPSPLPRLGLVGVLEPYRRKGLGRALIARAFGPLADRAEPVVTAETDVDNVAGNALLTALGGRITGGSVELRRSPPA